MYKLYKMTTEEIRKETERIIYTNDYAPGMIFHEHNKYWIGILKISSSGIISVLEGEDILNLNYFNYTKEELKERLTYELFYGSWVSYYGKNYEIIKLWLRSKIQRTYKNSSNKGVFSFLIENCT